MEFDLSSCDESRWPLRDTLNRPNYAIYIPLDISGSENRVHDHNSIYFSKFLNIKISVMVISLI